MIPYAVNKLKSVKTDKNQEPDTKHRVILKKLGDRGGTSGKVFQSLLQTRCHSLEQPDGGKSRTVSLLLKTRKLQALCFLFARQRGTRGQTLTTHWHQKAPHLPESLHADQRLRAGKGLSLSICERCSRLCWSEESWKPQRHLEEGLCTPTPGRALPGSWGTASRCVSLPGSPHVGAQQVRQSSAETWEEDSSPEAWKALRSPCGLADSSRLPEPSCICCSDPARGFLNGLNLPEMDGATGAHPSAGRAPSPFGKVPACLPASPRPARRWRARGSPSARQPRLRAAAGTGACPGRGVPPAAGGARRGAEPIPGRRGSPWSGERPAARRQRLRWEGTAVCGDTGPWGTSPRALRRCRARGARSGGYRRRPAGCRPVLPRLKITGRALGDSVLWKETAPEPQIQYFFCIGRVPAGSRGLNQGLKYSVGLAQPLTSMQSQRGYEFQSGSSAKFALNMHVSRSHDLLNVLETVTVDKFSVRPGCNLRIIMIITDSEPHCTVFMCRPKSRG